MLHPRDYELSPGGIYEPRRRVLRPKQLITGVVAGGAAGSSLRSGLQSVYKLNEGSGTTCADAKSNNANIVLPGSHYSWVTIADGSAVQRDNTADTTLATCSFTFGTDWAVLFRCVLITLVGVHNFLMSNNSDLGFELANDGGAAEPRFDGSLFPDHTLSLSTLHNLIFSSIAGTVSCFVDGVVDSHTFSTTGDTYDCFMANLYTQPFNGDVSALVIWTRGLTQAEATKISGFANKAALFTDLGV